jgi:hypothetical protein
VNPTQVLRDLEGTYGMQITAQDLQPYDLDEAQIAEMQGTYEFVFNDAGKFSATRNGQYVGDGNVGFNGNELNVQVLHSCENCGCEGNIGRYAWSLDENQLVLRKIYDNCEVMVAVLSAKPLLRK